MQSTTDSGSEIDDLHNASASNRQQQQQQPLGQGNNIEIFLMFADAVLH